MLADGRPAERAVAVLVDGLRAGEVGIVEIGLPCQHVAAVVVEPDHEVVVALGQLVQQDAAGIEMVDAGVPDREERRDRLDRRMAGAGEETGRRRRDRRCRSSRWRRRTRAGRRSSRRSRGNRRARWASGRLSGCRSWRRCRARRRPRPHSRAARRRRDSAPRWGWARFGGGPVPQREAAVIGRQDQDRRNVGPAARSLAAGRRRRRSGSRRASSDIAGGGPRRAARSARGGRPDSATAACARRHLSASLSDITAPLRAFQGGQRTGPVPCVNFDLRKISCAKRNE